MKQANLSEIKEVVIHDSSDSIDIGENFAIIFVIAILIIIIIIFIITAIVIVICRSMRKKKEFLLKTPLPQQNYTSMPQQNYNQQLYIN